MVRSLDNKYLLQMKKRGEARKRHLEEKRVWVWAIGRPIYENYGKDMGVKIPKNTFLTMEIHYEPIGKKLVDFETKLKLKFHPKMPKYSYTNEFAINNRIKIPPYDDNFLDVLKYKVKKDMDLMDIAPHMHLRGKASSASVINPNGKVRKIFKLDSYNFNFQQVYTLKTPLFIPKNSTILCKNWFDNSANNPINPDPSKTVRGGIYTKDEMSICNFFVRFSNF